MKLLKLFIPLIFLFNLFANKLYSETPVIVDFRIEKNFYVNNFFKLYLINAEEKKVIFDTAMSDYKFNINSQINLRSDTIKAVFVYMDSLENEKMEEFDVLVDHKKILSLNIDLVFAKTKKDEEFLKFFKLEEYYPAENLKIFPESGIKIGGYPTFKIINNSDKVFYGYNAIKNFIGYISIKKDNVWKEQPFSICLTTAAQEPLYQNDSVVGYVPSYNEQDRFYFKEYGEYKFRILLTDDEGDNSILIRDKSSIETTKLNSEIYVLTCEFELQKGRE
ncbi:MAG: hypothetical protein IAE65_13520 [Ignavibacteria bacterium]|nr:hypothetical protein [Ignavibacteria bacterium]